MSDRTLIDPIDDPQVDEEGYVNEAPESEGENPEVTELQAWAQSKGFDPNLDPKFLESYRHLEQDHGRLRNEIGESRQLMDRVIRIEEERHAREFPAEQPQNLDPTDLISDPQATLDKYFEEREKRIRQEYDARIAQLEGSLQTNALSAKHADAAQLVNDPNFLAYVQSSPIRTRVAQQAVQHGDVGALDELLTDYKANRRESAAEAHQQNPERAKSALDAARRATLESNAPSTASSSDRIISRASIIKKKLEDPEGYSDPAYQEMIMRAYAEKRVK